MAIRDRTLREMVRALREFEGNVCLWRIPVAGVTVLLTRGLPVAAAAVAAVLAINGQVRKATVGASIALLFEALRRWVEAKFPWRVVVAKRLWSFEKPNPANRA